MKGLYTTENIGNTIVNGGDFGPEGGIIVTIIILICILLVYRFSKKNVIFTSNDKISSNKNIVCVERR